MKFRVWFDPLYKKRETEDDGVEIETISAEVAAELFGEQRYSDMQHVDPGVVLVRDLETNELTRWDIAAQVVINAYQRSLPTGSDGC